jgi:hypothetical protein
MKKYFIILLSVFSLMACKKEKAGTDNKKVFPVSATFILDRVNNIYFTNDSCLLIAGDINYKPILIKTNYNFDIKWSKNADDWKISSTTEPGINLSGSYLVLNDILQLDSGKYVCFLYNYRQTSFVIELNEQGEQIHAVNLPNVSVSKALKTSDGGYLLYYINNPGSYITKTDENYHTIWQKYINHYAIKKIVLASDGGYAGLLHTCLIDGGCVSNLSSLSKYDSEGNILFSKFYSFHSGFYDLIEMPDQGFLLIGYADEHDAKLYYPYADYNLVRTNASGDTLWTKTFGDSISESLYTILSVQQNEILMKGRIFYADTTEKTVFFKINAGGQILDSIKKDGELFNTVYSPLHYFFTFQQEDSAHFKITRIEENMFFDKAQNINK